jgi:hypothetical protein
VPTLLRGEREKEGNNRPSSTSLARTNPQQQQQQRQQGGGGGGKGEKSPLVGLARFTHVILQSKHGSIGVTQYGHVTNLTPSGSDNHTRWRTFALT